MRILLLLLSTATLMASTTSYGQDLCKIRGELDAPYCDRNRDLVADTPNDPALQRNPQTLVFSWTPVEDPAIYEKLFTPFVQYLAQCTGKKVQYMKAQSYNEQIEAMRAGNLHVASFSTGPTAFAVNVAGAVPFAIKGDDTRYHGYHLLMIVRSDSPFHKLIDLKGRQVAHVSASSNSGHVAPMALFPRLGVTPGKDYEIVFSGKHDASVLGVGKGQYDAAAVASDVFYRMVRRGTIKEDDFRIVYKSAKFPTESIAYAYDLDPKLRDKMLTCFYDYRFTEDMRKTFDNADRFYPASYEKDWKLVRMVGAFGDGYDRAAYNKEVKRQEEARMKSAKLK